MKLFPSTHSDLLNRLREVIRSLNTHGAKDNQQVWYDFDHRYRQALVGFGRRRGLQSHDCQTLANDVLLVVYRKLLTYDRSQTRFHRWLLGIASKAAAELKRQNHRACRRERPLPSSSAYVTGQASPLDPCDELLAREQCNLLGAAILKLRFEVSDRDYRLFERVRFDKLPINAAAAEIGMTAEAARKAMGRTLRKLARIARRLGLDQP
ncbi:MAG: RNA polymerase sigma factor [Pirellulales bacterium]